MRKALGLGKVHMLGHSWGGWLAIDYALTYPENLKTLILEDTVADMPHLVSRAGAAARGARARDRGDDAEARGAGHLQPPGIPGGDHHPQLPPCLPAAGLAGAGPPLARRLEHGPYGRCRGRTSSSTSAISRTGTASPDLPQDHRAGADHLRRARRTDAGLRAAHEARPAERRAAGLSQREPHAFLREPGTPIIRS